MSEELSYGVAVPLVLAPFAVVALTTYVTYGNRQSWYARLTKPPYHPPGVYAAVAAALIYAGTRCAPPPSCFSPAPSRRNGMGHLHDL